MNFLEWKFLFPNFLKIPFEAHNFVEVIVPFVVVANSHTKQKLFYKFGRSADDVIPTIRQKRKWNTEKWIIVDDSSITYFLQTRPQFLSEPASTYWNSSTRTSSGKLKQVRDTVTKENWSFVCPFSKFVFGVYSSKSLEVLIKIQMWMWKWNNKRHHK